MSCTHSGTDSALPRSGAHKTITCDTRYRLCHLLDTCGPHVVHITASLLYCTTHIHRTTGIYCTLTHSAQRSIFSLDHQPES